MSGLHAFLRLHRRIALDTNVFIYHLEDNRRYSHLTNAVFSWLEQPGASGVTSTLTMTELLVQPLRNQDETRANLFHDLLSTYPHLAWIAPDLPIARLAARYRALHGLKTIDALHAATAVRNSATGLITNDAALTRVDQLEVLVLDTLL